VVRDARSACRASPVTIILVTHDLREAAFLADRIFCMSSRPGRIIAERQVEFARPRDLDITYTASSPIWSTICARRSPPARQA
jgi:NitT/TauT family transport system ATP-binding protein